MYRRHFALCSWPFGPEIAPDEMYPSTGRAELNARLEHLVEMSGIGLITGDCGSGKSSACRSRR
jgi:general secretion pathway protein A